MSGFIDSIGNFAGDAYNFVGDTFGSATHAATSSLEQFGHGVGNFFGDLFKPEPDATAAAHAFLAQPHPLASLTAEVKQTVLEGAHLPAAVVPTSTGTYLQTLMNHRAVEFSFNGVHEGPAAMLPVVGRYAGLNVAPHAVLYDEENHDLDALSSASALAIEGVLRHAPPDTALVIDAYSMGTRLAYGTLAKLELDGMLNRDTQVNLYASTTAGYDSANAMPDFLGGTLLDAAFLDMGSHGGYQSLLDVGASALAGNNHVQFHFVDGTNDSVVPGVHDGQPAGGYDWPRLLVDPQQTSVVGATHNSIRDLAADLQVPAMPSFLIHSR